MNLTLKRLQYRSDGIFSDLKTPQGDLVAQTLEHAYFVGGDPAVDAQYAPKLPKGTYNCVRGKHRLHGMTEDFETFEIKGVEGHTNILFHWGNYNRDSEGCVLLGKSIARSEDQTQMITHSRDIFASFMRIQQGVDEFSLTVC